MQRQGKGMDLFHSGVTLVMSGIEGLAAVQDMLPERSLTSTLALHNSTLRSLLSKYCAYEVCCCASCCYCCLLLLLTLCCCCCRCSCYAAPASRPRLRLWLL